MNRNQSRALVLIVGDVLTFVGTIFLALVVRHGGTPDPNIIQLYWIATPFLVVLWFAGFLMFGLYDLSRARNTTMFFDRLARAVVFDAFVTALLFYAIPEFRLRPLVTLAVLFIILSILTTLWRLFANALFARIRRERVLFLGDTLETRELAAFLSHHPQIGFAAVGFYPANDEHRSREKHDLPLFSPDEPLTALATREGIERIVIAHGTPKTATGGELLFGMQRLGVRVTDYAKFYEAVERRIPVYQISESWFSENLIGAERPRYEFAKRITDLIIALFFGVFALLAAPFIALAIVLSTPGDVLRIRTKRARPGDGPIFFRQPRVGKNGRVFNFVKFRSQRLGSERMHGEKEVLLGRTDPRAYPVGTFLRKTYLDEMPQLWNVIKGEMSFVGPRPERPEYVAELQKEIPFYRTREFVLPGITGWAQISMVNDASVSDAPEKLQYDLYYIKNRSVVFDIEILLKTTLKLLQRSGR